MKTNVVFVVDASTSIDHVEMCGRPGNFQKLLAFAANVLKRVESNHRQHVNTLSPDTKDVQVGCITFANEAAVVIRPTENQSLNATGRTIEAANYVGGNGLFSDSNTHVAVDVANRMLLQARQGGNVKNTVVFLTDGRARNADGSNMTNLLVRELRSLEVEHPDVGR